MVTGLMGEILYFIVSSGAVRGSQWRRSRMRPERDIMRWAGWRGAGDDTASPIDARLAT
jgi:hypothetical protein